MQISIGNKLVGPGAPTYIIAEVSCNHCGSYEKAADIVRAAAEAEVDGVKLQTYTAETMTIDCNKPPFRLNRVDGNPGSWSEGDKNLFELYQEAYTPWDWQLKLKAVADKLGIQLFSTPFDPTAVSYLAKEIDPPCYKIASYELTDDTLLKAVAETGKPVIISNGYATQDELEHAIVTLRKFEAKEIIVLYCVTEYADAPTSENVNLATINDIAAKFGVVAGFSDNNGGIDLPIMSVLAGGHVIEKHLIMDKEDPSHDQRFSVTPSELKIMVDKVRTIEGMSTEERAEKLMEMDPDGAWLGEPVYGPTSPLERQNRHWRRSLYVVEDVKAGEKLTSENVRSIRPEGGLAPKRYFEIVGTGRTFAQDVECGDPLTDDLISPAE